MRARHVVLRRVFLYSGFLVFVEGIENLTLFPPPTPPNLGQNQYVKMRKGPPGKARLRPDPLGHISLVRVAMCLVGGSKVPTDRVADGPSGGAEGGGAGEAEGPHAVRGEPAGEGGGGATRDLHTRNKNCPLF